MNFLFPSTISKNIIMHLTSTIMSSHTVFNYIIGHKEDEFLVLQNELLVIYYYTFFTKKWDILK